MAKITLKSKDIYYDIAKLIKNYSLVNSQITYCIIRNAIRDFINTNDNIYIIFFEKYALIKYKDYNNFNWDVKNQKTFSGGLSNLNPKIMKLFKGLILVKENREKNLFKLAKININNWSENKIVVLWKSLNTSEVIRNILEYEYIKDTVLELEILEKNGWINIKSIKVLSIL